MWRRSQPEQVLMPRWTVGTRCACVWLALTQPAGGQGLTVLTAASVKSCLYCHPSSEWFSELPGFLTTLQWLPLPSEGNANSLDLRDRAWNRLAHLLSRVTLTRGSGLHSDPQPWGLIPHKPWCFLTLPRPSAPRSFLLILQDFIQIFAYSKNIG